jgi:hypothetical protein
MIERQGVTESLPYIDAWVNTGPGRRRDRGGRPQNARAAAT